MWSSCCTLSTPSSWAVRWFLYPPEKTPTFHPNKTILAWLHNTYLALAPSARPLESTIQAGEVLYFPDRWWHATLNLDVSVFIFTFFRYHKELLVAGSGWSSGEKHVTRDELERLLTWKVAQLVAANPPELVVRCSAAAFRLLPDVLTAVTELCARRSVGAATASAVLAAGAPEAADFMSHEAVARVSGLPAQQYILQHYRLYLGQMQDHAKALSQASASGPRTRQPAETALWTWAVGRKMCPGLLPDLSPGTVNIHVIRPAKRRRTQAD